MKKLNHTSVLGDLVRRNTGAGRDVPEDESVQEEIRRRWARCAGNAAGLSTPLLFRSSRLVVYTRSPIWATELLHQQQRILAALSDLGARKMVVRTTPSMHSAPRPTGRPARVSSASQKNIARTAHRLQHPGLRAAVEKLARRVEVKDDDE